MIGDLLLIIGQWWKENITCRHEYKHVDMPNCQSFDYCPKCGRIKTW